MEQKMNNNLIFGGLQAAIALFLVFAVKVFAPVCDGMVETAAGKQIPMRCHYASQILVLLGVVLLIGAVALIITKQKTACGILAVAISVVAFLVLNNSIGIGICANPDMACNMTKPFVQVASTLGVIIGGLTIYAGVKEK